MKNTTTIKTPKKTTKQTLASLIKKQRDLICSHNPNISKKDADFIARTIGSIVPLMRGFVDSIAQGFSKSSNETDKEFEARKNSPAIQSKLKDILLRVAKFMELDKPFREHCKEIAKDEGKEALASYLFLDYVLQAFYEMDGLADLIEKHCNAAIPTT